MTSSSMWDSRHGPYRARLNLLNRGGTGAWSSRYKNVFQWLQIDLGQVSRVVAVATQGRYDANQWVKKYEISYAIYGNKFKYYSINRKVLVGTANLLFVFALYFLKIYSLLVSGLLSLPRMHEPSRI